MKGKLEAGAVDLGMSSHTSLLGNQPSMFSHISLLSNQPNPLAKRKQLKLKWRQQYSNFSPAKTQHSKRYH
jgi:hypothetical protein